MLSFLRGAGLSQEPSPRLSRKDQDCVDAVRYTPHIDWDSLEGGIRFRVAANLCLSIPLPVTSSLLLSFLLHRRCPDFVTLFTGLA